MAAGPYASSVVKLLGRVGPFLDHCRGAFGPFRTSCLTFLANVGGLGGSVPGVPLPLSLSCVGSIRFHLFMELLS